MVTNVLKIIVYKGNGFRHTRTHTEEKFFLRWDGTANAKSERCTIFRILVYMLRNVHTTSVWFLHGPGCQGNWLHTEYFAFLRKVYKEGQTYNNIGSIKNLRPKVACSLSRRLQWNSMWWAEYADLGLMMNLTSELDELMNGVKTMMNFLLFWGSWTMFNLKNSFPVLLFQSKKWTVSKIRKLSCSCSYQWNFSTDKKALVWLNSELKARVGPISLRGFSENQSIWCEIPLTDELFLLLFR